MIKKEITYITEDGNTFNTIEAAEAWESKNSPEAAKKKEKELQRQVYKNLFEYLYSSYNPIQASEFLEYLIINKKEILMLLTNGNLDTVYAPRDFNKKG